MMLTANKGLANTPKFCKYRTEGITHIKYPTKTNYTVSPALRNLAEVQVWSLVTFLS